MFATVTQCYLNLAKCIVYCVFSSFLSDLLFYHHSHLSCPHPKVEKLSIPIAQTSALNVPMKC